MATGSVFSETLQAITTAKLSELSNKRATFDARHESVLSSLQIHSDPLTRVTILLKGVKHCFNIDTTTNDHSYQRDQIQANELENDIRRLESFLEQARVDPSLTGGILSQWEETLNRHLDVQSQRYQYATLYGQLVTEWLSPDRKQDSTATIPSTDVEMGDGFEELTAKKRLEERAPAFTIGYSVVSGGVNNGEKFIHRQPDQVEAFIHTFRYPLWDTSNIDCQDILRGIACRESLYREEAAQKARDGHKK